MKIYLELFGAFFRIGLFTFGGGFAMLSLLQKEMKRKAWAETQEFMEYYAIGQVIPGVISVNVATFIGYKIRGWLGALVAVIGVTLPSIIIVSLVATGLSFIWDNSLVQNAFMGIQVMIPALLFPVVMYMLKRGVVDFGSWFVLIVAIIATVGFEISPALVMVLAACLGVLWKKLKRKSV